MNQAYIHLAQKTIKVNTNITDINKHLIGNIPYSSSNKIVVDAEVDFHYLNKRYEISMGGKSRFFTVDFQEKNIIEFTYLTKNNLPLDKKWVLRSDSLTEALIEVLIQTIINYLKIQFSFELIVFHASVCMDDKNKVIAFTGGSFSGKSTIIYTFAKKGFHLLSDEYMFISPTTGMVYPYRRPVKLRSGVLELPGFNILLEDEQINMLKEKNFIDLQLNQTLGNSSNSFGLIDTIYFLDGFSENCEISSCSLNKAMRKLSEAVLFRGNINKKSFDNICQVLGLAKIKCIKLSPDHNNNYETLLADYGKV